MYLDPFGAWSELCLGPPKELSSRHLLILKASGQSASIATAVKPFSSIKRLVMFAR